MNGLQEKQLGLYQVESHNKALVGLARAVAREICGRMGSVTIDEVRRDPRMVEAEFIPCSPNVWGSVFHGNDFVCIGWEPSTLKSNHSRFIRRWKYEGA